MVELPEWISGLLIGIGGLLIGLISTKKKRQAETETIVMKSIHALLDEHRQDKEDIRSECRREKKELNLRIDKLEDEIAKLKNS